jgi:hypothetical protein
MDDDFYRDFTSRIGAALEAEDRLILGSGRLWNEVRKGGILRLNDERYYQSILSRAMLSRWSAAVEYHSRYDLVLFDADDPETLYAVFELKRWMGSSGERELPGIGADIRKLQKATCPKSALVVFSSNKRGDMKTNIEWLENEWKSREDLVDIPRRYTYCFDTISPWVEPAEFWVGVWPIKCVQIPSGDPTPD